MREIADAAGMPLIIYLKSEDGFGSDQEQSLDAIGRLVDDGVAIAIKYAIVRQDPRKDAMLDGLLKRVDRRRVITGMGERPAVVHLRDFQLGGMTTGSGCIAPGLCSEFLMACARWQLDDGREPQGRVHAARRRSRRLGSGARASSRNRTRRHRTSRAHSTIRLTAERRAAGANWRRWRAGCGSATRESSAEDSDRAAQLPLVRQRRPAFVQPPVARPAAGLHGRRHGREAHHRDPQHLERRQPVSRALPAARGRRQARRLAGWRLPHGDPAADARRDLHEADDHALPQPAGDGSRGSVAFVPGRWRHPARWLRQDRAGDGHGRDEREPPVHLRACRADVPRQLARAAAWIGHRRLEVLGRTPRRDDRRMHVARDGRGDRPVLRHVHDHGHGLDDGGGGRRARIDAAWSLVNPGRRFRALRGWLPRPDGVSSRWSGKT